MDMVGGFRARAFGLLIIVVIVVADALLIAGYGVAVGLGALAGLILGTIVGIGGSLWLMHGPGRSVSFGPMYSASREPTPEFIEEMRDAGEIGQVDLGPVVAIQPVLDSATARGLSVELLAVEYHEAGIAFTLDVRAGIGALPPQWMARVVISDDVGTDYRAYAHGEGGSMGDRRYQVTALPALPPSATRLDIRIDRFLDPMPGREPQIGPWSFSVALHRPRN